VFTEEVLEPTMDETRSIGRELVFPLIIGIASGAAGPLVTAATSGKLSVPRSATLVVGGIALLWAAWVVVKRAAAERRRARQAPFIGVVQSQMFRDVPVMTIDYGGVKWRVVETVDALGWSEGHSNPKPDDIDVSEPPRCPQCETELCEEQGFWGSWKWYCPGCQFALRGQRDYGFVSAEVLRIARRRLERGSRESPEVGDVRGF
jgi:hypothetical protein